jgi:hypothetical protein
MVRRENVRKPKKQNNEGEIEALRSHLARLKLEGLDDYRDWCATHGFAVRTRKSSVELREELQFAECARIAQVLAQKKKQHRAPLDLIEPILDGGLNWDDIAGTPSAFFARTITTPKFDKEQRDALRRLVTICSGRLDLLSSRGVVGGLGQSDENTWLGGLVAVARLHSHWIRPLEEWTTRTKNDRRRFASLVRHLFAIWPVPTFMDTAWFKRDTDGGGRQQRWFVHLGAGQNIRTADVPIELTKRMAHHFMSAQEYLSIEAALRWGQISGLGGYARLFEAVVGTRLGTHFDNDDFWITVLRFFVANPMLDPAQIGPIVDYIHHQRFEPEERIGVVAAQAAAPAQPQFSMKGRTAASLLRQVETWHRQLARSAQYPIEWRPCGIPSFAFVEGSERSQSNKRWTIREILSSKALTEEGRAMRHCVGSYARSCAKGACSIWSLQVKDRDGARRVLTVEVRLPGKLICQARGKFNVRASEKELQVLQRWASQAALQIATYL